MNTDRDFVRHRNDHGIPPDRTIQVIESKFAESNDVPEISAIIPTLDGFRDGYFPSLLQQLCEQTFQNFETIIISGDPRQGRAINTGAANARGRFLLTLDDDTRLMSNQVIELLFNVMQRDSSIGMAGGINIVPQDASAFIQKVMREIPRRLTPEVKEITDSDLAEHPLLLIRKDVFLKVGGENELIPRGLDPYLRSEFRKFRYRIVVVPQAFYSHLPPPTLSKLIRQFYRNGRQAAFLNKYYPQWVIETPDVHVEKFIEKRPLLFRAVRFFLNLLKRALRGHLIYLTALHAYAIGFIFGYLTDPNENKSY